MALITRPVASTSQAVQEARHLALPTLALGAIIAILYFGRVFFITAIVAITIAFILEPFVALAMRLRLPRALASFLVCALALLFLYIIALAAYTQIASIYSELPKYGQRIADLVDNVRDRIVSMEEEAYRMVIPARQREAQAQAELQKQQPSKSRRKAQAQQPPPIIATQPGVIPEVRIHEETTPVGEYLRSRLNDFYQDLLMVSFIPFLVYFMLSWRDHLNRTFLQFFQGEDRLVAARSLAGIADMVRAFVVGNFILGLLMAAVSSLAFWQIGLSYPLLVGPLSGFLSLAPYVGLPLALIPPLFTALAVNSVSVYVLVTLSVALLHLVAMNLLYPKLVGSRVHLNPLVVTFSLMLWGFLWDAPGLLLAIPITAALKAVCDNVKGLRPIGKFLGD
jgi:predicted PurR-regulated permease PerM